MSEFSDMIRKAFGDSDRKRDVGLKTPKNIIRFDNISYGPHTVWNLLDVYRPKKVSGKLPVIAVIHGGAWVYGDKDVYQFYGMSLAGRGFAVVNFSYRLAPEYKYPAQLEDICLAFKFIYSHADAYGFDLDNIFAVGDSAGALLLTSFSDLVTNPDCRKDFKAQFPKAKLSLPKGIHLNAVALNCGKYDLGKDMDQDSNAKAVIRELLPKKGTKKEMELVSGDRYVNPKFPPAFVMTCPGDFIKDQAKYIVEALTANGVPFCYRYYGSDKDPLHHVFHCNVRLPEAKKCNDDECKFFKEYISH
ncbi:MAG: alpha/beta hydrolase [Lachnospiraceae bacterium]|nr:alpha/beta hydrolase [Lachnospiraceae bacterium]